MTKEEATDMLRKAMAGFIGNRITSNLVFQVKTKVELYVVVFNFLSAVSIN